jgi:hypothetical protein
VLRTRKWGYVVLLGQLFLLAEIGLIAYGIKPDPNPHMSLLLWLAAALLIADAVVMVWGIYRRRMMLEAPAGG